MNRRLSASTLALVIGCLPVQAWAQDTTADPAEEPTAEGGIAEIIVSAQKRDENVQDVPIAISVFGGDTLQERAVNDVAALSTLAPNVNLDGGTPFSGSSAVLAAFI